MLEPLSALTTIQIGNLTSYGDYLMTGAVTTTHDVHHATPTATTIGSSTVTTRQEPIHTTLGADPASSTPKRPPAPPTHHVVPLSGTGFHGRTGTPAQSITAAKGIPNGNAFFPARHRFGLTR